MMYLGNRLGAIFPHGLSIYGPSSATVENQPLLSRWLIALKGPVLKTLPRWLPSGGYTEHPEGMKVQTPNHDHSSSPDKARTRTKPGPVVPVVQVDSPRPVPASSIPSADAASGPAQTRRHEAQAAGVGDPCCSRQFDFPILESVCSPETHFLPPASVARADTLRRSAGSSREERSAAAGNPRVPLSRAGSGDAGQGPPRLTEGHAVPPELPKTVTK